MSKDKKFTSERMNIQSLILSILATSFIFTILFTAFFRIMEGEDWFFINGGWLANIVLLFILGIVLSFYYYLKDYNRFKSLFVEIADEQITFYAEGRSSTFSKINYYDLKQEKHVFNLFKQTKLIFIFKKKEEKKKNYQSILCSTSTKEDILKALDSWKPYKKENKK